MTIEYKGTNFAGWQVQPDKRTVQGEIENSLLKIFGEEIKIHGSGRTDAGVHALGQTAHFALEKSLFDRKFNQKNSSSKNNNLKKRDSSLLSPFIVAINSVLPDDIKILKVKKVNDKFHARYDVKEKIYLYKMECLPRPSPLLTGLVGTCKFSLDVKKMQEGATYLIGEHDFTSFSSAKTGVTDFVRTVNYIKIKKASSTVIFEISGNGFLYNMVRIIVGTLVNVGIYKLEPKEIKTILDGKARSLAGKTTSASGLYLKKVKY